MRGVPSAPVFVASLRRRYLRVATALARQLSLPLPDPATIACPS